MSRTYNIFPLNGLTALVVTPTGVRYLASSVSSNVTS